MTWVRGGEVGAGLEGGGRRGGEGGGAAAPAAAVGPGKTDRRPCSDAFQMAER